MGERLLLGKFYPGNSILHRLDPRTKFMLLIVLMVTILIPKTTLPMLVIIFFSFLLVWISKIPLKVILSSLRSILYLVVFAFLINVFAARGEIIFEFYFIKIRDEALRNAILMASRLILLVMDTTLLLTLTTTTLQLSDAIESLFKPLEKIKFPSHEVAMMMSIALRFVPTLLEETDKIMKAQSSRGANYDTGGMIKRAKGYVSIIVPLFISCFRRADELAFAMEARCYRGGKGRTKLRELKYSRLDLFFSLIFVLACALILFAHYRFANLL